MFKALITFLIFSSIANAQELASPKLPNLNEINKKLSPVQSNCENCQVVSASLDLSAFIQNSATSLKLKEIKEKNKCLENRKRLDNDVSYFISASSLNSSPEHKVISGNFESGYLPGKITEAYAGISAFRDIMLISKIEMNGKFVGYNIELSYCSVPNTIGDYPSLVSDERQITGFQAPYGIVLNSSKNCEIGQISAAYYTYAVSKKTNSEYTSDFPIYTTFSNTGCM